MTFFSSTNRVPMLGMAIAAALLGVVATAHGQAFSWKGGTSDPTAATNYDGAVPTFNANNAAGSFWLKYNSSPMVYSAAQGTTTFSGTGANSLTWISWSGSGGTGGTANQATLQVTGGTLNLNGSFGDSPGTVGLWVGNGTGSNGFLTVNGGNVSVANGTVIGRDGSTGILSLTSGSFTTGSFSSAVGTYIGANYSGGAGAGTLTIGNGGQFTLATTATNPFVFGAALASSAHTGATDYVNFTIGSTGKITLNLSGATLGASYFNSLITNGYVEIGGVVNTSLAAYSINTSNLSAATLSLAVPEPSTWAAVLSFLGVFACNLRRRQAGMTKTTPAL